MWKPIIAFANKRLQFNTTNFLVLLSSLCNDFNKLYPSPAVAIRLTVNKVNE